MVTDLDLLVGEAGPLDGERDAFLKSGLGLGVGGEGEGKAPTSGGLLPRSLAKEEASLNCCNVGDGIEAAADDALGDADACRPRSNGFGLTDDCFGATSSSEPSVFLSHGSGGGCVICLAAAGLGNFGSTGGRITFGFTAVLSLCALRAAVESAFLTVEEMLRAAADVLIFVWLQWDYYSYGSKARPKMGTNKNSFCVRMGGGVSTK